MVTTEAMRRAKLQSNRYHQQTNTQLLTGRKPISSCCPTNCVKALKEKYHIQWTCSFQFHLGSSDLVFDH